MSTGLRRCRLLLPTLTLVLALAESNAAAACEPLRTLTFDCATQCGAANRPCIRYQSLAECASLGNGAGENAALSTCAAASGINATTGGSTASTASSVDGTACAVECFAPSEQEDAASFTFFVPFSLSKLGGRPVENATRGFLAKNEDALKEIAVLDIPDAVTAVYVVLCHVVNALVAEMCVLLPPSCVSAPQNDRGRHKRHGQP